MKTFQGQVTIPVRLGDCFGCVETGGKHIVEREGGGEGKREREHESAIKHNVLVCVYVCVQCMCVCMDMHRKESTRTYNVDMLYNVSE